MITFLQTYTYRENRTTVSGVPAFKSGKGRSGKGFSTLEMLIAMSILTVVLTGVVLTSFGNQGMLLGGEANAEAMNIAQELLEQEQQLGRKDFRLVNAFATTTESIYQKSTWIEAWGSEPYAIKRVTAFVTWTDQNQQKQILQLTTLISNFTNAVGGDTCNSAPTGNWSAPLISNYALANGDLLSGIAGTFTVSSVDAYRGKLWVSVSQTSAAAMPSLFVFSIQNAPQKPVYVGSLDTATTISGGPRAVVVGNTVRDISTGVVRSYAYVANGYGANFDTCMPAAGSAGGNCAQMQVIDVTDPTNPTVAVNFKFATSTASVPNIQPYVNGSAGQAVGKSIFYKDGYVYLGLSKTSVGNEFHIIDVHNPLAPAAIGSGFSVGNDVNAIYVRGKYAYLSTPNTQELITVNLGDPLTPVAAGGFNSATGAGNGKSLFAVGDKLYAGMTVPNAGNDFHILDITTPGATLPVLGGIDMPSSVNGVLVRDTLAYLLTNTVLTVFNVSTPGSIGAALATLALPGTGESLDCEGNTLYAASNSGPAGFISVVQPGP